MIDDYPELDWAIGGSSSLPYPSSVVVPTIPPLEPLSRMQPLESKVVEAIWTEYMTKPP